jgi:homoserine dehydrogenase
MEREEVSFAEALAAAQELGFAEADPSLDIDGVGTAHKAAIIGALAYGYPIDINDIYTRGISEVQPLDIVCANELGYRIKLLATIEYRDGQSEISVSPTLVPHGHPLAEIDGEYNAVMIDGDIVGETMYYGRGAGCLSVASAVLADIAELAAGLATNSPMRLPSFVNHDYYGQLRIMGNVTARYYMRVTLMNAPGVLSKVSAVMGENGVGIESAIQRGLAVGEMVPVIFLTQKARVWNCLSAMMAIDMLEVVGGKTVCYRIANF